MASEGTAPISGSAPPSGSASLARSAPTAGAPPHTEGTPPARPAPGAGASPRLAAALVAVGTLVVLGLVLAECVAWWRIEGPAAAAGSVRRFWAGVAGPAIVLAAAFAWSAWRRMAAVGREKDAPDAKARPERVAEPQGGRAWRNRRIVAAAFAVGAWCVWSPEPHLAALVAMSALLTLSGVWAVGRRPDVVVRATLLVLLVAAPSVTADALVNHREHWVAALPDYGNLMRPHDSEGNVLMAGGLLLPSVNRIVRGAGLWQSARWITDADGFRNRRPLERPKPAGRLRILALGDSFSCGYRTDQDATFPARLEQRLRDKGLDVEVRNACTEDPIVTADYLARFGDAAQPDVVVLGFCIGNDFAESDYRLNVEPFYRWDDAATDPRKRIVRGHSGADPRVIADFKALAFPADCLTRTGPLPLAISLAFDPQLPPCALPWAARWAAGREWRQAWAAHASPGKYLPADALTPALLNAAGGEHPMDPTTGFAFFARQPIAEVQRGYSVTGKVLGQLRDLCQGLGARLVVVPIPQQYQVTADSWRRNSAAYGLRADRFDVDLPNQWLATTCKALDVACVDPLEAMRAAAARRGVGSLYQSPADMHWSARAADMTSAQVAEWLLAQFPPAARGR